MLSLRIKFYFPCHWHNKILPLFPKHNFSNVRKTQTKHPCKHIKLFPPSFILFLYPKFHDWFTRDKNSLTAFVSFFVFYLFIPTKTITAIVKNTNRSLELTAFSHLLFLSSVHLITTVSTNLSFTQFFFMIST